jgi:hypothetical protein
MFVGNKVNFKRKKTSISAKMLKKNSKPRLAFNKEYFDHFSSPNLASLTGNITSKTKDVENQKFLAFLGTCILFVIYNIIIFSLDSLLLTDDTNAVVYALENSNDVKKVNFVGMILKVFSFVNM